MLLFRVCSNVGVVADVLCMAELFCAWYCTDWRLPVGTAPITRDHVTLVMRLVVWSTILLLTFFTLLLCVTALVGCQPRRARCLCDSASSAVHCVAGQQDSLVYSFMHPSTHPPPKAPFFPPKINTAYSRIWSELALLHECMWIVLCRKHTIACAGSCCNAHSVAACLSFD